VKPTFGFELNGNMDRQEREPHSYTDPVFSSTATISSGPPRPSKGRAIHRRLLKEAVILLFQAGFIRRLTLARPFEGRGGREDIGAVIEKLSCV